VPAKAQVRTSTAAAMYDIVADRDVGVFLLSGVHQQRELAASGGGRDAQAERRELSPGPGSPGLRRMPGVHGHQSSLAQSRVLERERQGIGKVVQVTDAHADQSAHVRSLVADHHHRKAA
jgi:hypothetical protein